MKKQKIKNKYVLLGDIDSINIEIIIKSFKYLKNKVNYLIICNKNDLANKQFSTLGPDALSLSKIDKFFVMNKAKKSSTSIKKFLLNQKNISGLGNIYVNEILNLSSVNPKKMSKNLSIVETKKIIRNTKITLKKAISLGGSSIRDFKGVSGNNGYFQQNFMVYNRSDQMCKKPGCRGLIKKIYISNRSTFYCLKCQK